jgi:hypothetical protein
VESERLLQYIAPMHVNLTGANGEERALIVNALREKAQGDFEAARGLGDPGDPAAERTVEALREQARLAERLASELE